MARRNDVVSEFTAVVRVEIYGNSLGLTIVGDMQDCRLLDTYFQSRITGIRKIEELYPTGAMGVFVYEDDTGKKNF